MLGTDIDLCTGIRGKNGRLEGPLGLFLSWPFYVSMLLYTLKTSIAPTLPTYHLYSLQVYFKVDVNSLCKVYFSPCMWDSRNADIFIYLTVVTQCDSVLHLLCFCPFSCYDVFLQCCERVAVVGEVCPCTAPQQTRDRSGSYGLSLAAAGWDGLVSMILKHVSLTTAYPLLLLWLCVLYPFFFLHMLVSWLCHKLDIVFWTLNV